jgi:hypothetical protein
MWLFQEEIFSMWSKGRQLCCSIPLSDPYPESIQSSSRHLLRSGLGTMWTDSPLLRDAGAAVLTGVSCSASGKRSPTARCWTRSRLTSSACPSPTNSFTPTFFFRSTSYRLVLTVDSACHRTCIVAPSRFKPPWTPPLKVNHQTRVLQPAALLIIFWNLNNENLDMQLLT